MIGFEGNDDEDEEEDDEQKNKIKVPLIFKKVGLKIIGLIFCRFEFQPLGNNLNRKQRILPIILTENKEFEAGILVIGLNSLSLLADIHNTNAADKPGLVG